MERNKALSHHLQLRIIMETVILLVLEALLLFGVFYGYIYRFQRKIEVLREDLRKSIDEEVLLEGTIESLAKTYEDMKLQIKAREHENKTLSDDWSKFLMQNQQLHFQVDSYRKEIDALKIAQAESEQAHIKDIQLARKDAVDTSRAVLKGKISEEMAPFLPGFPYDSSDCKFFGSPIDILVFDGMSEGNVKSIVIVDIKTGKANLSKTQKQIKDCIENGRVAFYTHKM